MNFYLASRYSRRLELVEYRQRLIDLGHTVTARWLNGAHQISDSGQPIGPDGESLVEGDDGSASDCAAALRELFAIEDVRDVMSADVLIAFTEQPRSGHTRGGRHVEMGMALGRGIEVWVCGPRENIFCWLAGIQHFERFEQISLKLESMLAVKQEAQRA